LIGPSLEAGMPLMNELLAPLHPPRHPIAMARFGLAGLRSAKAIVRRFSTEEARGLFAGLAGHSMIPLDRLGTAAPGLVLMLLAHLTGWPLAAGGSGSIVSAMEREVLRLGGVIRTGQPVETLGELPESDAVLFDLAPSLVAKIAADELPERYRNALNRFRQGPGSFKIDYALDGPIPWAAEECRTAGTIHLGGTFEEIATAERTVTRGEVPDRPYILLAQQSMFDPSRAPAGKHTVWAYCHVPRNSTVDMTERIERQIERFAPGFRDLILAKHITTPRDFEAYNPNYIGGDIGGGLADIRQLFFRPTFRFPFHSTPNRRLYICSASTPPGGGVHGLCGYYAAKTAMRRLDRAQ
jgi:phytoene dehydrogenase-like protein